MHGDRKFFANIALYLEKGRYKPILTTEH